MKQETSSVQELKFGCGVFVCVFNRDFSKILLLRRNEEKRKKYGFEWGNVGGKLEFREYSLDGCIREAREEIGLEMRKEDIRLIDVIELPYFHDRCHGINFLYATSIDEDTKIKINEESSGYHWFDLEKLPESMADEDYFIREIRNKSKKLFVVGEI